MLFGAPDNGVNDKHSRCVCNFGQVLNGRGDEMAQGFDVREPRLEDIIGVSRDHEAFHNFLTFADRFPKGAMTIWFMFSQADRNHDTNGHAASFWVDVGVIAADQAPPCSSRLTRRAQGVGDSPTRSDSSCGTVALAAKALQECVDLCCPSLTLVISPLHVSENGGL